MAEPHTIDYVTPGRFFCLLFKPPLYHYCYFCQFLPPSLCHTLLHIPGPPRKYVTHPGTPRFLVGLVQKTRTKAPCTNYVSIVRGGFCQGVLSGGRLSGRFCPRWFLSGPSFVRMHLFCYNRNLNITLNFMFHMYDKKMYKCDVTCSLPPSTLSQTVTSSRTPLPARG